MQEASPDLGTRGWGRVRCQPPAWHSHGRTHLFWPGWPPGSTGLPGRAPPLRATASGRVQALEEALRATPAPGWALRLWPPPPGAARAAVVLRAASCRLPSSPAGTARPPASRRCRAYRPPPRHEHVGPAPPNPGSETPKPGPDSETVLRAPGLWTPAPPPLNQSQLWKSPSAALPQVPKPIPSSPLFQTFLKAPPTLFQNCKRPQPSRGTTLSCPPKAVARRGGAGVWRVRGPGRRGASSTRAQTHCCYQGLGPRRCPVQTAGGSASPPCGA